MTKTNDKDDGNNSQIYSICTALAWNQSIIGLIIHINSCSERDYVLLFYTLILLHTSKSKHLSILSNQFYLRPLLIQFVTKFGITRLTAIFSAEYLMRIHSCTCCSCFQMVGRATRYEQLATVAHLLYGISD